MSDERLTWLGVAGLSVAFAALAVSLFVFFDDTPHEGRSVDGAIAVLEKRIETQADAISRLEAQLDDIAYQVAESATRRGLPPPTPQGESSEELMVDAGIYGELMRLSDRRASNEATRPVSTRRLLRQFGRPAEVMGGGACAEPTSPALLTALTTRDVGPFKVRLVRPAAESVARIFDQVRLEEPRLLESLRSYGGLCARLVRGSEDMISRHAFGVALDLSVGGALDEMGDGRTQLGLILLADYFQDAGWVWGAAFGREDSMHFEVGKELFASWYGE